MTAALPWLLLVVANLLWGSSLVAGKVALAALTPLQASAARMVLAGLLVLPWLMRAPVRRALPPRAWAAAAAVGLLGFALSKFLMFWGLARTTAAESSLLTAVEPLLTIGLGWLLLRERLGPRRWAAFALGAVGAWLLVARGLRLPALGEAHVAGAGVFLLGLAAEAACSVLGRALVQRHAPGAVTAAMIAGSLGVWLPVALAEAGTWPAPDAATWAAVAYLAVGCTVLPYALWFHALRHLEAGRAALTLFLQPMWGAALGVALLGEPLRPVTLAGGALVLAALWVTLRERPAPAPTGSRSAAPGPCRPPP